MKTVQYGRLTIAAVAALVSGAVAAVTPLEEKIAAGGHKILTSDTWGGGHRRIFEFEGRKGWVVEPESPRADKPWVWTMQWMGAYLNRTGAPALVGKGFHHVHLEAFDTRADENGLKALASFQKYLVTELGFAPKSNLIGMSWGGFYSVRYANAYPENVSKIYLDAPLLSFSVFNMDVGPWASRKPADGDWSKDENMPVNMAASIAKAGIPVYLLYGGQDQTVNPSLNCEIFVKHFKAAGGKLTMDKRGLYGHHPHGFEHEDIGLIVKFFGGE